MPYEDPDIISDETTLAEQFLDTLADQVDGWEPHDGQVEPVLAEAAAVLVAPVNTLLKDTLRQDYAGWGLTVLGVERTAATQATTTVMVEMADTDGHTMPAGAQLVATVPSGDEAVFVTLEDAVADPGEDGATGVPIAAVDPGVGPNGASGIAELVDSYEFVLEVTLEAPAAGGVDEQDIDDYVDEVSRRARRFLGIPATVADLAAAALDVPGVARALAIPLLDPDHPEEQGTEAAEAHQTVVPLDAAGDAVAPAVADDVVEYLSGEEDRLLNVVVHTMEPTLTPITVAFTASVTPGSDGPTVIGAAEAAVAAYLDKSTYGADEDAPGGWAPLAAVYYLEVDQVVQQVEGIHLVTALTLNGGTANVPLAGLAPLPDLTSVDGTLAS